MNYKIGTSWCYDDEDFNCKKYGRLYDWNTAKKVCPSGWHLPSRGEWNDLVLAVDEKAEKEKTTVFASVGKEMFGVTGSFFGKLVDKIVDESAITTGVAGNVVSGKKLKSKEAKGTDNYGFSALLGGGRNDSGFYFKDKGSAWWTATEYKDDNKKAYDMYILNEVDFVSEGSYSKSDGYSVRCVKDHK